MRRGAGSKRRGPNSRRSSRVREHAPDSSRGGTDDPEAARFVDHFDGAIPVVVRSDPAASSASHGVRKVVEQGIGEPAYTPGRRSAPAQRLLKPPVSRPTPGTPGALRRLAVPRRVADQHRRAVAVDQLQRDLHEVGRRWSPRPEGRRVLEVLGAEQLLVALRVLLLARGREHDVAAALDAARRSARRRAPAPPRRARAPRSAASPTRAPRRRARARRPRPRPTPRVVAAHPDVAVQLDQGEGAPVLAQRAEPRQRMLVVGVDQRPVHVEQDGGGVGRSWALGATPAGGSGNQHRYAPARPWRSTRSTTGRWRAPS